MFEKVKTEEIRNIRDRLKSELRDKNLPFQRREEVNSLIYYLGTWLEERDYKEREHYREVIQSES